MGTSLGSALVLAIFPLASPPGPLPADTLRVVEDETVVSVVVQTTGVLSRFAPDHLMHAGAYEASFVFDPDEPEDVSFEVELAVEELMVNEPTLQDELEPRLLELGILGESYREITDADRREVRSSMLAPDQLDAEEHPRIQVELVDVRRADDDADFPWTGTVALTVRETLSESPFQGRVEEDEEHIRIEAFSEHRFTDLGIEPYSAFLGTVRNSDEFHLYLRLTVERSGD